MHDATVTTVPDPVLNDPEGMWAVACRCGWQRSDYLLSRAMRAHDDHAGIVVSHIHTAEMLEA